MPTFFEIALDYLPIQASLVPSKCVFSSSAEMDTKKRNRINPELMEALQILKFALKQSHLNFTHHWLTPESMLQEREPEPGRDLLAALLGAHSEDIINRIIQENGDGDDDMA
jgi:hAT family C-terminal dimerisation region